MNTGKDLYQQVKGGLVAKHHLSLHAWCKANGLHRQNARDALLGKWKGPRAQAWVEKLKQAAGVSGD